MEWTVITVLVALAGLIAAVVKPLLTLNTTITKGWIRWKKTYPS